MKDKIPVLGLDIVERQVQLYLIINPIVTVDQAKIRLSGLGKGVIKFQKFPGGRLRPGLDNLCFIK